MKSFAHPMRGARSSQLPICALALLLGAGLLAVPAHASGVSPVWITIQDSAPRSVFDEIRDSAPLAPVFETLRDSAP
ncbi:MAG: hypothetical protein AB7L90_13610 [Hyphomicrobiaceae bacterium]